MTDPIIWQIDLKINPMIEKIKKLILRLRLLSVKLIVWVIKKLTIIKNKIDILSINNKDFEKLTPTKKGDEDGVYSNAILWALNDHEIKNIAVTGPYGSGKSSIIRTFEKNHPEYRFLNISLASFNDYENNSANIEIKDNFKDKVVWAKNNQLIELSILQQIFYHVKHNSIKDSRFKRIKNLSTSFNLLYSISIIIWIIAIALLFFPSYFVQTEIWKHFKIQDIFITWVQPIVFILTLIGLLIIITKGLRIANNYKINKLNIQKGEIEINCENDASILNKHLDELLYFFEATNYNALVIEDLDRFEDTLIFLKLRELNTLINSSKQINKHIVFFYALKDDMFKDRDRTKFFDFIIPVIPIINSSNSGEIILNKFKDTKLSPSSNLVSDISFYIDDMRLLKNIYNEYIIYKDKIGNNLIPDHLFAMIVFKNVYPSDFAELNNDKGVIYSIFKSKHILVKDIIEININKIEDLRIKIDKIKNNSLKDAIELRTIYICALWSMIPGAESVRMGNNNYTILDLKEESKFNELINKGIQNYHSQPRGYFGGAVLFSNIQNQVDSKVSYHDRLETINLIEQNKLNEIKSGVENLINENNKINTYTIKQIFDKGDFSIPVEKLKKETNPLIFYLLRHGYIDENYFDYISYFYAGSITNDDKKFILSIKNHEACEFSFRLSKIKNIIKKIFLNEFSQPEILNYNLLDYLVIHTNNNKEHLDSIIGLFTDKNQTALSFLDGYIECGINIDKFINILANKWKGFWYYIENESNHSINTKNKFLGLIIQNANIEDIELMNRDGSLSKYIAEMVDFLSFIPTETIQNKIKDIIKLLDIKFKQLNNQITPNILFDFIYESNYYIINPQMIDNIIQYKCVKDNDLEQRLQTQNFTIILESQCTHLIQYIEDNIESYISDVLLNLMNNNDESEESIIQLLNYEHLSNENKELIIQKNNTRITSITEIDDIDLWELPFKYSKVLPTWENIYMFYECNETLEPLIDFLNIEVNYTALSTKTLHHVIESEKEDIIKNLSKDLILSPSISYSSFVELRKSIYYTYSILQFEMFSLEKVEYSINSKLISLTIENFTLLKNNFPNKQIALLERDSSRFIETIKDFTLDKTDVLLLLNSEKFTDSQKINVISNTEKDLFENNKELSTMTCKILANNDYSNILPEIIITLIKFSVNIIDKITIINKELRLSSTNEEYITKLINELPYPFSDIAIKGLRPRINNNSINLQFAILLQKKNYISTYKEKGKDIKINTKNK